MARYRRLATACVAAAAAVGWVLAGPSGVGHAAVASGTTVRSSLADHATTGTTGAPISTDPGMQSGAWDQALSGDGRYEAFVSHDPNWTGEGQVAPGPGSGFNDSSLPFDTVYIRDLKTGETSQVSFGATTGAVGGLVVAAPNGDSDFPSVSADGRYVSFMTSATNIPAAGAATQDGTYVVCDRDADGSRNADGSYEFRQIPAAGKPYPGFYSCIALPRSAGATSDRDFLRNLPGVDGWPRLAGGHDGLPLRIVWGDLASDSDEVETFFGQLGTNPLSPPGNVVDLVSDTNQKALAKQIGSSDPAQNGDLFMSFYEPAISDDGGSIVVAMVIPAYRPDIAPPTNMALRFSVGSLGSPKKWPILRVDKAPAKGFVGNGQTAVEHPAVSNGGARIAFDTAAVSLLVDASNDTPQVYAVDASVVKSLTSVLVSVNGAGGSADGEFPALSADGRYISFITDMPSMTDAIGEPSANCEGSFCDTCITDTGSAFAAVATAPAASPVRIPCQAVARDLVVDGPALAAGTAPGPAQLASPSINLDCDAAATVCDSSGQVFGPLSVSASGSDTAFNSASYNVFDDLVDTSNDETDGIPEYAYVHTWTPKLTGTIPPFGNVVPGTSSQQTMTLTLVGFGPMPLGSVTVTGADPGDFVPGPIVCPGGGTTVQVDAPCTVSVTFTPGALGPRSATIVLGGSDPNQPDPVLTVPVNGTGSNQPGRLPQFSADPSVDFGSQLPLKVPGKALALTVTDAGGSALDLTSVVVADTTFPGASADYSVNATSCLGGLAPGASCQIVITFVGHAVGTRDAVLVVTDNTASGVNQVALLAKVPKPKVQANPGVSAPGHVTLLSGTGFAPGRMVDVGLIGSAASATGRADAHGKFTIGLVVLDDIAQGPQFVTAHTHGVSPTISAKGPLLVTLGTVDVPQLITRH